MKELIDYLQKEFPEGANIMTPQFERTEELEFNWKPTNDYEFKKVISEAPIEILKGMGFGAWDTMNELIDENNGKPENSKIEIPIINSDQTLKVDTGKKDLQTMKLDIDEMVLLIPGEWYDIIPDGFLVTGLYGEQYPFKKGESDDDIRFGCLPYGIRRQIQPA